MPPKKLTTMREKIADLACLGEVEGFVGQLEKERRMTPEIENLIALRRAQISGNASPKEGHGNG